LTLTICTIKRRTLALPNHPDRRAAYAAWFTAFIISAPVDEILLLKISRIAIGTKKITQAAAACC
jgi:hypothetical protein